jgi:rhodanese-related sulfurtransferase
MVRKATIRRRIPPFSRHFDHMPLKRIFVRFSLAGRPTSVILDVMVTLTPEQTRKMIDDGSVDVIDVRNPDEWAGGHLPNARLIPLAELRANPGAYLTRDNVVFVCAAGVRSQTAARLALGVGLTKVFSMSGGTQGWVRAGLPLVNEISVAV